MPYREREEAGRPPARPNHRHAAGWWLAGQVARVAHAGSASVEEGHLGYLHTLGKLGESSKARKLESSKAPPAVAEGKGGENGVD